MEYGGIAQLMGDSSIVVVAKSAGVLRPDETYGDKVTPFALMDLSVEDALLGKVSIGDTVTVALEAGYDEEGTLYTDKLTHDNTYMLFLSLQGERAPGVYAVTGYLAGIYQQVDATTFHKVDPESPRLPESVTSVKVSALAQR